MPRLIVGRREKEELTRERAKELRSILRTHQKKMEEELERHYYDEFERLHAEKLSDKERLEAIVAEEEKRLDDIVEETGNQIEWLQKHLQNVRAGEAAGWEGRTHALYEEYTSWEESHVALRCPAKPTLAWWRFGSQRLVDVIGLPPTAVSDLNAVYEPRTQTVFVTWTTANIDGRTSGDLTFIAMLAWDHQKIRRKDEIFVCFRLVTFGNCNCVILEQQRAI